MRKPLKPLLLNVLTTLILGVVLVSCSSGNKFASSFSKRKYTKGYFWNNPERVGTVIANSSRGLSLPLLKEEKNLVVISKPNTTIVKSPHPVGGKQHSFLSRQSSLVVSKINYKVKERESLSAENYVASRLQEEPEAYQTNGGGVGFFLLAAGFLLSILSLLLVSSIGPAFSLVGVLGTLASLVGFIICIVVLAKGHDKHKDLALAGLAIIVILAVLYIIHFPN